MRTSASYSRTAASFWVDGWRMDEEWMENGWMDDKQETVRGHVIAEGTRAGGRDEDYTEGRVETVHDHDHGRVG
jgi:hypothetical protein